LKKIFDIKICAFVFCLFKQFFENFGLDSFESRIFEIFCLKFGSISDNCLNHTLQRSKKKISKLKLPKKEQLSFFEQGVFVQRDEILSTPL